MRDGHDALVVTTGITLKLALDAARELEKRGIQVAVLHMHTIKPIDRQALVEAASSVKVIITVEENSIIGGLGSSVSEVLSEAGTFSGKKFLMIGLPDAFPDRYGSQENLMGFYGVTKEAIVDSLLRLLNK